MIIAVGPWTIAFEFIAETNKRKEETWTWKNEQTSRGMYSDARKQILLFFLQQFMTIPFSGRFLHVHVNNIVSCRFSICANTSVFEALRFSRNERKSRIFLQLIALSIFQDNFIIFRKSSCQNDEVLHLFVLSRKHRTFVPTKMDTLG